MLLACGFVDHQFSEICAEVYGTTCIQLQQEAQFKIVIQREAPLLYMWGSQNSDYEKLYFCLRLLDV